MTMLNRGVRIAIGLAVLGLLSACASTPKPQASSYDALMTQAESAVMAGRVDDALVLFVDAGKTDPVRKEPWVRSAQLQFDKGNYARAIVASEEVLQRDPDDLVADSILTVAGFRIASQSLQRLRGRGALASEGARKEAETLVATIRETMGDDILMPEKPRAPARTARSTRSSGASRSSAPASPPATAPRSSGASQPSGKAASDPFKDIGGGL